MLILVRLLFVVTVGGVLDALVVASSVDAVDGRLLGMLLYAALPGVTGFVLSLYVRTGGVWIWRGLLAVHAWLTVGALATLGEGTGGQGVAQLVMPVAVVVLLFRSGSREWFRLSPEQRVEQRPFSIARMTKWRRDAGQTAMEYLGMVLVVVALIGGLVATGIGGQLTGEIRNAICQLTGSACPAPDVEAVAGKGADAGGGAGSEGSTVTGGTGSGGSTASGGSGAYGGSGASGGSSSGSGGSGGTDSSGGPGSGGFGGADTSGASGASGASGGSGGSTGGDSSPQVDAGRQKPEPNSSRPSDGNFISGVIGDGGLWGDVSGAIDTVIHPVGSVKGIVDQYAQAARGAGEKWSKGDHAGAIWDMTKASGGGGGAVAGLPGSGSRVEAAVRDKEREYLNDRIPGNATAAQRKDWWNGLTQQQRDQYLDLSPDRIGSLDGIPVADRDAANRKNLPDLISKLEGKTDSKSKDQLAGLREIDRQLKEGSQPPMYLIGISDEGNGRAIVSYGNPDTSKNVSAYVPGLNTSLDEEFAKNDLKRARDTAIGAQGYDSSTASIVWLGYDAPQTPDGLHSLAVAGTARAEKGGVAYSEFMGGIAATNQNADPHITAIGHSYGSRTVGAATQRDGGIPGVDDIILVGSPGVGVDRAVDLGVGSGHVFVGAAANDPVTKLPSKTQAAAGVIGMILGGPAGAYIAGDLADPGDDDLWFGKDPASKAFGAKRFPVAPGQPLISTSGVSFDAHSNYFDPVRDAMSADSIALIVSGHSDRLKMEEQR
ncbi:alpha/beta hydrolase family protein [Streptomyces sp. NBC_01221]|uniref:alpha/beta hydrolase n=1 Tax=Streptomyces sp. NBC_01221 TaxID=2903782 RepID=UPI0022586E3C|nr:alpha/beta hydrolase [Streptomyces sp. NBC_01221]MCX4788208.1 alpha/beta hydrolase family protein [Streptomyces sp. NBC_01221]